MASRSINRMTADELQASIKKPKKSKYGNVKTTRGDLKFDSKAEAERYDELVLLHRLGKIATLRCQPRYELESKFRDVTGKAHRAEEYVADFEYLECVSGKTIVEDVKGGRKGTITALFRSKQKRFIRRYLHLELRIVEK